MNFVVLERREVPVEVPTEPQAEPELKVVPRWWFKERQMMAQLDTAEDELVETDLFIHKMEFVQSIAMGFVFVAMIALTLYLNGGGM